MKELELLKIMELPSDECQQCLGIAFDGCLYYIIIKGSCRIYKYNLDFMPAGHIETTRQYTSICYDNTEKCFWASAGKCINIIYKLDNNLKEIDRILISDYPKCLSHIVDISCNCEKGTLFVAFSNLIIEISKDGCYKRSLCENFKGWYVSILSIAPYYIVVQRCKETQNIFLYSCEGCLVGKYCVSPIYKIQDTLFYPCDDKCSSALDIIVLAKKHCCYPRILQIKIEECDLNLCRCNYEICRSCHCDEGNKCTEQSICDLLESIALVEAAMSHILNAEGEKLQKAIELSESPCDLLEINKSINRTIMNATHLEHVLYAKLDAINSLCLDPCENHCDGSKCDNIKCPPKHC